MKKILTLMLSCMLLAASATPALANQWGLTGGIYDIVSDDAAYADYYTAIADSGNNAWTDGTHLNVAILESRYHRVLIAASRQDGRWQPDILSGTAVYQPGDKRGEYPNTPALTLDSGILTLTYGEGENREEYVFAHNTTGDYTLYEVMLGTGIPDHHHSYVDASNGLLFWQSGLDETFTPIGEDTWLTDGITLSEFNIAQMPRTLAEVRRLNNVSTELAQAAPDLLSQAATLPANSEGERLAVYSTPDAASFRAASGKASVSRGADCTVLGTADGWTLVMYDVSYRTGRIGYVQGELTENALSLGHVPLVAQVETFLTDDPFVSQYAQTVIPAGAELTGLAKCGEFYAYVALEQNGVTYRGFVPLKDVDKKYDTAIDIGGERLMADVRWDVMDALTGKWRCDGGDFDDTIIIFAAGQYGNRSHMLNDSFEPVGNFRVYDAADTDGSTYEIVFFTEDGQELRRTIRLNEDATVTVTDGDTTTIYHRGEYSTYGNG